MAGEFMAGLGSAGGDLASTVVSGLFGQHSAKKQMQFQERMSNTAYQRAAKDLQKAGLNRILALGSPSTTPSGASATMPDAKIGSSFQAGASAKAQRNVQDASKNLIAEQERTEQSQQALLATQAAAVAQKLDSEIKLNQANALAAVTASKRGSGVAEISQAIADLVKDMRDPKGPQGVIPTIVENLPNTVLGPKGVNSARSVGRWIHDKLHGTPEEQKLRIKNKWDKIDRQNKGQSRPTIKGGPKRGSR